MQDRCNQRSYLQAITRSGETLCDRGTDESTAAELCPIASLAIDPTMFVWYNTKPFYDTVQDNNV